MEANWNMFVKKNGMPHRVDSLGKLIVARIDRDFRLGLFNLSKLNKEG